MKAKLLTCVLALFLAGCYVQSLHRFYTDDLKIDLPQIEGEWVSTIQMGEDVSGKKVSPWLFTKDTIQTYDENNKYSELEVAYFMIDDVLFMDFTAGHPLKDPEACCNFFWGAGITLTHSLCRVSLQEDRLVLVPMNIEWFEERIKEKKLGLSFIKPDENSNYIFTATAEQWISFLKAHAHDKKVFDEKFRFVFKKEIET